MGPVPGTLQGLQCQCGGWVGWVVVAAWVEWVSLSREPPSCTRSTIPCSILTRARRASKLFIVGAFNSQLWWCVNTYVISVPMALLLYVCNSVSLVWITYRARLTARRRKLKVENGKRPAEDPVSTEGSWKSCQAEKSGEKKAVIKWRKIDVLLIPCLWLSMRANFRLATRSMTTPRLQQLVSSVSAPSASENILHHTLVGKKLLTKNHIAGLRCQTPRHTSSILKANTPNHLCQRNWRTFRHSLNGLLFMLFLSCYATACHSLDVMYLRHFVTWHALDCSAMMVTANQTITAYFDFRCLALLSISQSNPKISWNWILCFGIFKAFLNPSVVLSWFAQCI